MPTLLGERKISGRDAAFATELLAGTCRGQGTYDLIIAAAAGRELKTLQPAVLDLLRLGTHQLLAMRVPQHAAVAAMVDLAAATVGERVTGVVNAVLRRVAAADHDGWLARLEEGLDDHDRLALRTSHPRWIVDAYADLLPAAELEPALAANNVSPQVSLAIRPGLAEVDELIAAGAEPGTPLAVRRSLVRQPRRPSRRARGSGRSAGRGFPAGHLGTGPRRRAGRSVARSLRRPRRQDRAARRTGPGGRRQPWSRPRSPRTEPSWSARRSGPMETRHRA